MAGMELELWYEFPKRNGAICLQSELYSRLSRSGVNAAVAHSICYVLIVKSRTGLHTETDQYILGNI